MHHKFNEHLENDYAKYFYNGVYSLNESNAAINDWEFRSANDILI